MSKRSEILIAVAAVAIGGASYAESSSGGERPSFKTLALCIAAYEREHALSLEANGRLTSAKFNSADEQAAMADQSRHIQQASIINATCERMKQSEQPLAEQVKELSGLLDGLGPTGGSTRSLVAGAIRQRNLTKVSEDLEDMGATLDNALADLNRFESSNSNNGKGSRLGSTVLAPSLGGQVASELRNDMAALRAEEAAQEAERKHLALLAAQRRRDQQRITSESETAKSSGTWRALGVLAGIGLGVASRTSNASPISTSQMLRSYSMAQTGRAPHATPSESTGIGTTECSVPINNEPTDATSGDLCRDARAHVAWFEREASRARSCNNAQLIQYYQDNLRGARDYAAATCQ